MRALTILSAMLLAMAAGAYAALVVTAGGSDAGEPMIVLPVKPAPVRPAAPAMSPGVAQAPASVSSSPTPGTSPSGGQAAVGTGPAVAGMIAEQQRQPASSAAGPATAQAPATQLPATLSAPGLSIDLGSAGNVVSGQPAPTRSPPVRATPSNAPAGLGARPAGG